MGLSEHLANLLEAQLGKHPPQKHLFVGLRQLVEHLADAHGLVPPLTQLFRGVSLLRQLQQVRLIQRVGAVLTFHVGQVAVFPDLTQPHPHLAVAPEALDALHSLKKGLAGELLRHMLVPGQAQQIPVHVIKVGPVDLFKLGHATTSFHP